MTKLKRPIRIDGDVAYVTLTKGYVAIIDAADVPLVDGKNWCAVVGRRTVYASRKVAERIELLHRVIMAALYGMVVEHLDGDGLDCRRENLRLATHAQNTYNQRLARNNTSGFKGVSWNNRAGRWRAEITAGGKTMNLGYFVYIDDARAAYADASKRYHGKFGRVA